MNPVAYAMRCHCGEDLVYPLINEGANDDGTVNCRPDPAGIEEVVRMHHWATGCVVRTAGGIPLLMMPSEPDTS